MDPAETSSVSEELAAPQHEKVSQAQESTETNEAHPIESDQDKNFRQLRETNERLRQKDEQRDQMMIAMQQELLNRREPTQAAPEPEVDEFADLDRSDWSTIEQVEKLSERVADRRFEKKWAEAEAKRKKAEAPDRVKKKLNDFDAVVTKDNMKQLQALEPDVWNALRMIGDEEAQAIAAYKYIKVLVPDMAEKSESNKRIQQNAERPKSLSSSGGTSPLSQAGAFEKGLTPALKAQLLAEMNECARRA